MSCIVDAVWRGRYVSRLVRPQSRKKVRLNIVDTLNRMFAFFAVLSKDPSSIYPIQYVLNDPRDSYA
jgi:hypothetical protein